MMQLFTRILLSERFEEIRRLRIQDLEQRNQLFDEMLKDCENTGNFHSPIRWIQIPEHITPAQFEALALSHNLQIYGADRFIVGSETIPNAIRVSLISTERIEDYRNGLQILKKLLS